MPNPMTKRDASRKWGRRAMSGEDPRPSQPTAGSIARRARPPAADNMPGSQAPSAARRGRDGSRAEIPPGSSPPRARKRRPPRQVGVFSGRISPGPNGRGVGERMSSEQAPIHGPDDRGTSSCNRMPHRRHSRHQTGHQSAPGRPEKSATGCRCTAWRHRASHPHQADWRVD